MRSILTFITDSELHCGHLLQADAADHKWMAIYPEPPTPQRRDISRKAIVQCLLHSISEEPIFMMYDNIPWEEILQKKQILFFDSRWKPSERTKWKKMENLYPFLGWKFNLKKNRKVCQRPPMHSRDSTICWIESQQHLNGFKSLSYLLQCWTPGPILLWEDLIGGWCASLPPLHLVFQPAASSRHIFNY